MLLLNDQERYSVYVSAKIVIYFDCTIFFREFFIRECVLTSCVGETLRTLQLAGVRVVVFFGEGCCEIRIGKRCLYF